MFKEKLIIFWSKYWPLLTILLMSGLITWPVFIKGYFPHHDDLQVMRIFEMRKCLADLQIPCRWVPDMGFGFGYPLFNFYGVFAYYIGALISFIVGYIGAAKALFFIPLVLGGVSMYFLAKELFGKIPGFVGAILYLFAPYRALDTYVRGAIAESFAMAIIPLVLYFILKLIKEGKDKYYLAGSLSLAAFLLSHNIMTLLFGPVVFLTTLYFLKDNNWHNYKKTIWVFITGIGLAAFFIFPAYLEKNLVQSDSLTRAELDFRSQFVKVGQLFFDRSWNYKGATPQSKETISYQIGWPYWWIVIIVFLTLVVSKKKNKTLPAGLLLIFIISTFMTHNKSSAIWEFFKILKYVQFPWRFLSLIIFSTSLMGAYFSSLFKQQKLIVISSILLILTVFFNWHYFRPSSFDTNITDETKLTGENFQIQQKGSLLDYLPTTALEPKEPANYNEPPGIIIKSNSFKLYSVGENTIEIPVFDFPNWTIYVDGDEFPHNHNNILGKIQINVPVGSHEITGKFKNTPVREISNVFSLLSLIGMFFLIIYGKNSKLYS